MDSTNSLTFITESLPYRFAITEGKLPAALTLTEAGTLSGTVTKEVPDATVFVKVTDAKGSSLTQAFDLEVLGS